MERKSLSKSLRRHSIGAEDTPITSQNHHPPRPNMFKSSCLAAVTAYQSCGDHHRHHHHPQSHLRDYVAGSGLSWPPRSYPCTFCKREFRSAQALGGHMNVHRHDRARLRQSSPPPASVASASPEGRLSFPSFNPGNTAAATSPSPNPNLFSSSLAPFLPMRSHTPLNPTFTAVDPQIQLGTLLPFSGLGLTGETKVIERDLDFLDGPDSTAEHPAGMEDLCLRRKGLANNADLIKLGMEVEVVKKDLDLELRLGWPY